MPDIFGNLTPAEEQMRIQQAFRQRQQQFMNSAMAQSQGAQAGQALANIFAPSIVKYLDTRRARKAEVTKLLEQNEGLTEEEAKRLAKERVKPEFAAVRRARQLQETTSKFTDVRKQLEDSGASESVVEVVSRMEIANQLIDAGFVNEGQQLRQQAIELRKAEEERLLKLDELKADVESTRTNTYRQQLENYTDTDLYVNMTELSKGNIKGSYQQVRLMDTDKRDELDNDPNWIKADNWFKTQFTGGEAMGRKAPPPGVQENVISQLSMLRGLEVMREAIPYAGVDGVWPTGAFNKFAGRLGFGEDAVVNAVAVEDKMAADIQSIIKGIPSNYDASVFEKMIPRLGDFKTRRVYEAKINLLEDHTKSALELTIGFYKGTNQEFPPQIEAAARNLGVDIGSIEAWDDNMIQNKDEVFKAHEVEGRKRVQALTEEDDKPGGAGPKIGTPVLRQP